MSERSAQKSVSVQWRPDVLGAGFEATDIDLGSDEEGPVVATLVRAKPAAPSLWQRIRRTRALFAGVDVLYVHGWSDYFFQRSLAEFWTSRGATFYALDLRKYGRSLRPGQTPGYIESLDTYDEEIELALDTIASLDPSGRAGNNPRRLLLMGHSTGGLVLSLWADAHPGRADGLLLNSPWLEFQFARAGRQILAPLVSLGARINPREVAPQLDYGYYSRAQHTVGPADELAVVNDEWRPERSHPVVNGWMRAILEGHRRVSEGLSIDVPVGVLLSVRSQLPLRWSDELTEADTVLDVDEIADAAIRLGSSITIERIDGALHDVFLSAPTPRSDAFARMERWTVGWLAAQAIPRTPGDHRS